MTETELNKKYEELKDYIKELKRVCVAFSSGVDSTFLLKTAKDVLGDNVIAITALSPLFPKRESDEAISFCEKNGIKHIIFNTDELSIEEFTNNPKNRCYICKKDLFKRIKELAHTKGFDIILEGSNLDDENDYRPGFIAIKELDIKSPLKKIGFSKKEIRELSRKLNLPTSEKPSFACLASRFVYGEKITKEKLTMVDKAEQLLLDLGFNQVRVRIHDLMARIEILPEQFEKLFIEENRKKITENLKELGFTYVSLDLNGYRTGSMNETINNK